MAEGNAEFLNAGALVQSGLISGRDEGRTTADGRGVVICIIDYGFDLLHPALRADDGSSRFACLIDQNGTTLDAPEIGRLVETAQSRGRDAADRHYDPHANYFGRNGVTGGAHGTWVASVAAGSRRPRFVGAAPGATLVGVQLALPDSAWFETDAKGWPTWRKADLGGPAAWCGWRSYEDATAIAKGLLAGFEAALRLSPTGIVFNLSIGAWAGGHDPGSTTAATIAAIASACEAPGMPMVAFVAATGNAGADGGHYAARLPAGAAKQIAWTFLDDEPTPAKLEIWTDAARPLEVTLDLSERTADHEPVQIVTGRTLEITAAGQRIGVADHATDVRGGLSRIRIALAPPAGSRTCRVAIGAPAETAATLHAWIERDPSGAPRSRLEPSVAEGTLTSIACAPHVIAVAGLNEEMTQTSALAISGRGPAPWPSNVKRALQAPQLSAPASRIWGAASKSNSYIRGSGTSAAAALVSGAAARLFDAAHARGQFLHRECLLRRLLGRGEQQGQLAGWRPDIGYGPLALDRSDLDRRYLTGPESPSAWPYSSPPTQSPTESPS